MAYNMSGFLSTANLTFDKSCGVNAHFEPTGWSNDYSMGTNLPYTSSIGAKMVKLFIQWGALSNAQIAALCEGIIANGQTPCLSLHGYSSLPMDTAAKRTDWANGIATVVNTLKDKPVVYEIWNEPNTATFWGGTPSAADYVDLCNKAITAMRAVHPNCCILVGSVCPSPTSWPNVDRTWFESCVNSYGLLNLNFDGVSMHSYRTDIPENVYMDYNWMRGLTNKPIVQTEMGYTRTQAEAFATAYGYPGYGEEAQGWLTQRILLWNMYFNIRNTMMYVLQDDFDGNGGEASEYGLMSPTRVTHRQYAYMQQLHNMIGNAQLNKNGDGSNFILRPTGDGYDGYDLILYFNNNVIVWWSMHSTTHVSKIWNNGGWQSRTFTPWPQFETYIP